MAVAIQPLNLAQILSQAEAVKSARSEREHRDYLRGREQKLSEILANSQTGFASPEQIQEVAKVDPDSAIRLGEYAQTQQRNRFADSQSHIKLVGQLAGAAMQQLQQIPRDQWERALPGIQEQIIQGASEADPQFGQHLAQNRGMLTLDNIQQRAAAFGGYTDPQAAIQQEMAKRQALLPGEIERARQLEEAKAPFRQAGNAPRMSLPQGYRMNQETGQAERIPGLPADTGKQQKLPPASVLKGYQENHSALHKVDAALQKVEARPDSFGFTKGLQPEALLQRTDPEGVDARALVADIGSLVIHDRSGAAVTASETPRLRPFIPQVGDTPGTIKKKLENFKAQYEQMQSDIESTYNDESGYRLPSLQNRMSGQRSAPREIPQGARIQTSPSTGKRRYSTDGGRTWTVVE